MTANRDFKRIVRTRMTKTGESYTAARAQLLRNQARDRRIAGSRDGKDFAALAGKSDAIIKEKTGCTWKAWVGALDYVKAYGWPHRDIARYVREKYQIDSWWSQTVTVGYERIKGRRAVGQRVDGTYEATKSRTLPVSVTKLFGAFTSKKRRDAWLPGAEYAVRTSSKNKYIRVTWKDGNSVVFGFLPKGRAKSQLSVQHGGLPDKAAATRLKAFWDGRFDALAAQLGVAP